MTTREDMDSVYRQMIELEKIRDEIRSKCKHTKAEVGTYMWRVGSFMAKKICVECDALVGDPTPEEAEKWRRENFPPQTLQECGPQTGQGLTISTEP